MSDRASTTGSPAIDHCVLPVASLAIARERYEALGFAVAPDAQHPFGTGNACIFLADGTYLEPLAICDTASYESALAEKNSFILRDRNYRLARGEEGFSGIALKTEDAQADHERFTRAGISAGARVEFARPLKGADGSVGEARFRLAFSAPASAGGFCFTCQRMHRSAMGAGSLSEHSNGVVGLHSVTVKVRDMHEALGYFRKLQGLPAGGSETNSVMRFQNCLVYLEQDAALPADEQIRFDTMTFASTDMDKLRHILTRSNVFWHDRDGAVHVPPAPGQGATFIFQENHHEA